MSWHGFLHWLQATPSPGTITNTAQIFFFVLEGVLSISTREPALTRKLSVGQSHKIAPGTAHLVVNGGNHDCRFFLLQGVGTYDWNPAE